MFNKLLGKTRYLVTRVMIHLTGSEVAPLLGTLNQATREAADAEGDLYVLGEGLVTICHKLLEYDVYWKSAANEGNVFWNEGEAGDYFDELFTDSANRYLSQGESNSTNGDSFSFPITRNLLVMLIIASQGEYPDLETDLSEIIPLTNALKRMITLNAQGKLSAIAIHFSPAKLGEELTDDQVLLNFPELIPL